MDDGTIARDTWYRFLWCLERGHYDFLRKADKCDNFFVGMQWDEQDLQALRAAKRPAMTINKILSTMATVMGEQIYNRNEVAFRPAGEGATDAIATALQKVWQQIAQRNKLQWLRSDVFASGIVRSRGFYDVRMEFDTSLQGNVVITQMNSKNVVIDPDAEDYDPDEWQDCFTTKWTTWQDIELLYGADKAKELRERDASGFRYGQDAVSTLQDGFGGRYRNNFVDVRNEEDSRTRRSIRVLDRQYRVLATQEHFVDVVTGDTRPVPEQWERNRVAAVLERTGGQLSIMKKKVKRIKWCVVADDIVLHEGWSPYKHLTIVPYFPHFHFGRTVGLAENMLGPQEILNKTSSQELHIVNTTANSGWKVKTGSLVNMEVDELKQVGAQTGLVLELDDISNAEKIQPNQTPSGMDRISYKAEEHMKAISGVSDSMQGFDREDVAAKAIATKRQSGQTNLARVLDNLERSDYFLARNVLDLVQTFYTEERTIYATKSDLTQTNESILVNQYDPEGDDIVNDLTLGQYDIIITTAPDRASLEDSQFEQATSLRELGVAIPDDVLIENSRLLRRSEIAARLQEDKESPEAKKRSELEMRQLEAETVKLEGEAKEKHTKAGLDEARTKREMVDAQLAASGKADQVKLAEMQAKLDMEREKHAMDLEFKRQELEFKRQEFEMTMKFKQAEQAQKLVQQQEQHRLQMEQSERDAYARRAQESKAEESAQGVNV